MKPMFRIIVAGMALASCGPLSLYYRPGASVSHMQNDQLNCEVSSLNQAPVANEVRQRPPIYFPGNQYCGPAGCYYSPGYWMDGGVYTVDVNKDLRGRLMDQCMAQKGYQPVSIPRCSAAVKNKAPAQASSKMPPLTENSCIIPYDDGSWQIVTTG